MADRIPPFERLEGAQLQASDPADLVWLSASAGTGKTHVLSARVLRLLLSGVAPESILCLTFTKAGAAEMAERVHGRLAHWVRLPDAKLRKDLFALGEAHDDAAVSRARTLFAKVLDAPGGGLRIQTIHAFSQTLLAGFPSEAGLSPGFRPIEGREEAALARRTLGEVLQQAERGGDLGLIRDVQALSRRLGESGAEAYLLKCARDPEALAALGPREGIKARLRTTLEVPLGDVEEAIAAACADAAFDVAMLRSIGEANAGWKSARGTERAAVIADWLAGDGRTRAASLDLLHQVWAKADGEARSFGKGQAPQVDGYETMALAMHECCGGLLALRARAALAELLGAGLRAGQTYALAYGEAKRRAGLVDFDDLIRSAEILLTTPGMGDWVRYKLDQSIDHILVDEAQDTNGRQWAIVAALAGEFFAGEGARGARHRTIFTVGDFKQAIFGFQGTDPWAFEAARRAFSARAGEAGREIARLSLDRSFRSTPPVLAVVDRLIEELGAEALGLFEAAEPHRSAKAGHPGTVTLWRPLSAANAEMDEDAEEGWIDDATLDFASRLARQIREWLDAPLWLESRGRALQPEDVLVLVRRRGTLAALLVARLHAENVAVAGVDRLRLDAPLAVRDLLAAVRFALQPEDDLTLASLLVSPLFGWSQEELFALGHGRRHSLWRTLRESGGHSATVAGLAGLLAAADFTTPYRFLEAILSGPLDGRRKLLRRLGAEARDPIEELLNAAIRFESEATPSLQLFLDWFDRGEVEITRDPSGPRDAVRVMTVHGAKGLQAPLVILADATADPEASRAGTLNWEIAEDAPKVPVFRPRKAELAGTLARDAEAAGNREREEHWRLLYVALTRAEERLVIGGALGPRAKGEPPAASWYQSVDRAMAALGAEWAEDPHWSGARHYHGEEPAAARRVAARVRRAAPAISEPGWLRLTAPPEARPPRPLAPSSIGLDAVADPPPSSAMIEAARRGRLLHALFERLPGVPPERRVEVAERWLAGAAGVEDEGVRRALVSDACAIIADPAFAAIFGPDALAEAPIAAVVGGDVVAGTVDRLLVTEKCILVVDFKTGRRAPSGLDAVPEHHIRQMAAYVAALEVIFPKRPVEAALLYTAGPVLLALPPVLIERHKPGLTGQQQNLPFDR